MKPILFIDFDGTLCHDRFWRSLDPDLRSKVQNYLFVSNGNIVNDWMRGGYTSEEINRMIADEIKCEYDMLWNVFVQDCKSMGISGSVLEKIGSLRENYTSVLITDNMDSFDRFTRLETKLNDFFDEIANSYNVRTLKKDGHGASFTKILNKYQSPVSESILIDDSPATCELFRGLGGKSYLVSDQKSLSDWLGEIN